MKHLTQPLTITGHHSGLQIFFPIEHNVSVVIFINYSIYQFGDTTCSLPLQFVASDTPHPAYIYLHFSLACIYSVHCFIIVSRKVMVYVHDKQQVNCQGCLASNWSCWQTRSLPMSNMCATNQSATGTAPDIVQL